MAEYKAVTEDQVTLEMVEPSAKRPGKIPDNFITKNLRMEEPYQEVAFTEASDRTSESLDRSTVYGVIKPKWAVSSNARPKYVRFAVHSGFAGAVNTLLRDNWYLGKPNIIINVFGGNVGPKMHQRTRAFLEFCEQVNAWTIVSDQVHQRFVNLKRRRKLRNGHSSVRSVLSKLILIKPWGSLEESDQEKLTPNPNRAKELHVAQPDWSNNLSTFVEQAKAVLLPEIPPGTESLIRLTQSLASQFDDDGHREAIKGVGLHVCPLLNVVLAGSSSDLSDEILNSEVPTVVIADESVEVDTSDKPYVVVLNATESSTVMDLKETIRDLLTDQRLLTVDPKDKNLFKKDLFTKFYLNLLLDLKWNGRENCEALIESTTAKGIQQKLGSLIHFYRQYDLLDPCLKSGYDESIVLHPYIPGIEQRMDYVVSRAETPFTLEFKEEIEKWKTKNEALKEKREQWTHALKVKLSDELNVMLGHGACDYAMEFEDIIYIFSCFNYDWQLAKILRQHSTNRLLKCYLALGALTQIRERSSRGSMDTNEVEERIAEISEEASDIALWVDKSTGYDIGPMIFMEHKQFSSNSIMSLVKSSKCYSLLSLKTNVYNCIKKKWNGALNIHTTFWQIIFGILSFGLITPWTIKFVSKNSVKRELDVFLMTKVEKRGYWEKWKAFWTSCRTKCFVLMITYMVFLCLLTLVVLDNTRIKDNFSPEFDGGEEGQWEEDKQRLSILIVCCAVIVLSFLLAELDLELVSRKTFWTRLQVYTASKYNQLDVLSAVSFLLYTPLAFLAQTNETAYLLGKALVSVSYVAFFIRFTLFLQMFEAIGPKIITIKKMIGNLLFFVSFLILAMFGYGIISEFLLHPSPKTSSIPGALEVIKRPYINMFGELDLDNLEAGVEKGVCEYESALHVKQGDPALDCEEYTCTGQCIGFKYTARILLGGYSLTTVVLLTNLLISIFGKTYETDYEESHQLWQIQCYKLIKESETHFVLPLAPLNAIYSLLKVFKTLISWTRRGSRQDDAVDSTEWYVKELDRRIYEQFRDTSISGVTEDDTAET